MGRWTKTGQNTWTSDKGDNWTKTGNSCWTNSDGRNITKVNNGHWEEGGSSWDSDDDIPGGMFGEDDDW